MTPIVNLPYNPEDLPAITGGKALREAINSGGIPVFHRFKWSEEETRQLVWILKPKFGKEKTKKFILHSAREISNYAGGVGLFSSGYPHNPGSVSNIARQIKDLEKARILLTEAVALLEGLEDAVRQYIADNMPVLQYPRWWPTGDMQKPTWVTLKYPDRSCYNLPEEDWPHTLLSTFIDAIRAAEEEGSTIKGPERDWPESKLIEHSSRLNLTICIGRVFFKIFEKVPSKTSNGPFDQVLTLAFETVGLPPVVNKKALINRARNRM